MCPQNSSHPEHMIVGLHRMNDTSFPLCFLSLPGAKRFWNITGTTLYLWGFFRHGVEVRRQECSRILDCGVSSGQESSLTAMWAETDHLIFLTSAFSISETGIIISTLQGCLRIKWDHICKTYYTVWHRGGVIQLPLQFVGALPKAVEYSNHVSLRFVWGKKGKVMEMNLHKPLEL